MTLVLCRYEFLGQTGRRTEWIGDAVMVKVRSSADIETAFQSAMLKRQARWEFGFGARPIEWKLKAYWPEHGRAHF